MGSCHLSRPKISVPDAATDPGYSCPQIPRIECRFTASTRRSSMAGTKVSRPRGRPAKPSADLRSVTLRVRMTTKEFRDFRHEAEVAGMSQSSFGRARILGVRVHPRAHIHRIHLALVTLDRSIRILEASPDQAHQTHAVEAREAMRDLKRLCNEM
jgi:hypothetical protein